MICSVLLRGNGPHYDIFACGNMHSCCHEGREDYQGSQRRGGQDEPLGRKAVRATPPIQCYDLSAPKMVEQGDSSFYEFEGYNAIVPSGLRRHYYRH